jgi:DNA primase
MNIEEIISLTNAKETSAGQYQGHCPSHDDRRPSLAIKEDGDGVTLYCHAGCDYKDIMRQLESKPNVSFVSFGSEKSDDHIIKILNKSSPIEGTIASEYLINRGIEL